MIYISRSLNRLKREISNSQYSGALIYRFLGFYYITDLISDDSFLKKEVCWINPSDITDKYADEI